MKIFEHLKPEIIEEAINVSIEYTFWIIVYLVALLAILIGLKLLFNVNLLKTLRKALN